MKKIALICALLMLLTACGTAENAAETTTVTTSETTETTTVTTAETTAETTTETTVEITETTTETTTAEEVTEPQENGFVVSPSGYILDPANIAPENNWVENNINENEAYYLGTPMEGVNLYGVNASADKAYEEYTSGWGEDTSSQYIVAEHDGIADELPVSWIQRYGDPINPEDNIFCADFDGDGETEIAVSQCVVTGTYCCIYELTLFKQVDGHYNAYTLNSDEMLEGLFIGEISQDGRKVRIIADKRGEEYTYILPDDSDDVIDSIRYGSVVYYRIDGDKIMSEAEIFIWGSGSSIAANIEVNFTGEGFTYGDISFSELEY